MPFVQKSLALSEVDALGANIAAAGGRLLDRDSPAIAECQFLNHNGVAARGHHAAGKDSGGFTRPDCATEGVSRCNFTYQFKFNGHLRDIASPNRIAIHG